MIQVMNFDLSTLGQAGEWLAGASLAKAFASKILGKTADEVAGMIADPVAEYRKRLSERRAARFIRITSSAAQKAEGAGDVQQLPDYIAAALIESATLQDDETLQEKWAGLIASAALPETRELIHPAFVEILKTLSPQEAKFLDACYDEIMQRHASNGALGPYHRLFFLYGQLGLTRVQPAINYGPFRPQPKEAHADQSEFSIVIDRLRAARLIDFETTIDLPEYIKETLGSAARTPQGTLSVPRNVRTVSTYSLTAFGIEFVRVCRGPKTAAYPASDSVSPTTQA
ncbi:MAG TPA: Abi-alpha family protein [Bryobacteraceae bacterium]|nr:Abi-alpha family protein [Bryobacteraceae bacterium]